MNGDLFILRGVPGCGKSTVAETIAAQGGKVISADNFFIKEDGTYDFDINKLGDAHNWAQSEAEKALSSGIAKVVIANTNSREKEMKPYQKMGEKYNYRVHVLVVENRHGSNDIHSVPSEAKERMENSIRNSLKLK
jgi:predicted kinase